MKVIFLVELNQVVNIIPFYKTNKNRQLKRLIEFIN